MRPRTIAPVILWSALAPVALGTPEFVEHTATTHVYAEAADVTMREPDVPREGEAVDLWIRIGYSFYYDNVAVYYTTDGSSPAGSRGVPTGTTQVLRGSASLNQVSFVRNEASPGGNIDWWKTSLPAPTRSYAQTIRYTISAWHSGGGPEIFANNSGCSDGTCDNPAAPATQYQFTNKLAWPGSGVGPTPNAGYPALHFWKEEAVTGNTYIATQLDQNGSIYDIYYPSPGCVQGMGTRNEGYSDGPDTFPPLLPPDARGQMNLNMATVGIRLGSGPTAWLTNETGAYTNISQSYASPTTNTVRTHSTLGPLGVTQYDFAPMGVTFPLDQGGQPNKGLHVKRLILTNSSGSPQTASVYLYLDPALNGGDAFDAMYFDPARGGMVAYDNTFRTTSSSAEYNPTTFPDYTKNVSIYLAAAMKAGSGVTTDSWRDTSSDQSQGWIGRKVTVAPFGTAEVDICLAGGFDAFAGATGTYDYQVAPALDWFLASDAQALQNATDGYWYSWLFSGVTIETPNAAYNDLFKRSLLATELHFDARNGGVVAGMHNGAYPFVWPRDAVYASISLARTGHIAEAKEVFRFLKDVAYRANDSWGKGFWYQKYTTDGYTVWSAPQVDETACFPWGVRYLHDTTADASWLASMYPAVREAALASSSDSSIDSRLYFDDANNLMHSNNVWEDAFDDFLYSNAQVYRGLDDARAIASALGDMPEATDFFNRANAIKSGITGRLLWDGENTDISLLGIAYPFHVFSYTDPLVAHVADRINGVAPDRNGSTHPLVNFSGEFTDLINRYWGDTYWNGGPWFLSTLWYGLYYGERQDSFAGKADIDNMTRRIDLCVQRLGPAGLAAEQIAPGSSLLYPDFRLQAAWPNAWESMSTLLDAFMKYLDYRPDATANTMVFEPKLPTGWPSMTFRNVTLVHTPTGRTHKVDVTAAESRTAVTHTFTNRTGFPVYVYTTLRGDPGRCLNGVFRDGVPIPYTLDPATGRITVQVGNLNTGANAVTTIAAAYASADVDDGSGTGTPDGGVTIDDLLFYLAIFAQGDIGADTDDGSGNGLPDGGVTIDDLLYYLGVFSRGCA